ncbi:MAG: DUF362 domain-containing protein [Polyangiaceae bacterium]
MDPAGRRDFVKRIAAAGAALAGAALVGVSRWDRGAASNGGPRTDRTSRDYRIAEPSPEIAADLVIAKDDADPASLVRKSIEAMGGMRRFVARGDVVVVKPNIGWDRTPLQAANTNPLVVAEVVRLAFDAGAKRVVVTDASCNEPHRCFTRSGIWKAAYDVGADVILPEAHHFRAMRLRGELLDEWPVLATLVEADKLINVPIAKHHNLARYTGAMKNWYGSLGGRRNRLHQKIDLSIADLATFLQPTLTVIDATRVLVRNGPQGGDVADAKETRTVIASIDQVAADARACTLIGETPERIGYLALAEARGVGTTKWERLRSKEV